MRILASNVRFNNSALMLGALGNSPGGSLLAHSLVNDCANDLNRPRFQENNKKRKLESDVEILMRSTNHDAISHPKFESEQSTSNAVTSVLPPSMTSINLSIMSNTLANSISNTLPVIQPVSSESINNTSSQTKITVASEALSIFSASDFPSDEAIKDSLFGPGKKRPPPKKYISKKLRKAELLAEMNAKKVDNISTSVNVAVAEATLPVIESVPSVEIVKDSPIEPQI